ncbi:MAG: hypothetical protein IOC52_04760 [Methylobacterium sp.]|nr:hypothetical protein [Methylobacterium sp.]
MVGILSSAPAPDVLFRNRRDTGSVAGNFIARYPLKAQAKPGRPSGADKEDKRQEKKRQEKKRKEKRKAEHRRRIKAGGLPNFQSADGGFRQRLHVQIGSKI